MWAAMAALLAAYVGPLTWWVGGVLFVVALAVLIKVGAVRRPPRMMLPPVRGRWMALTSPVDNIPSQGTHAYGQTYALGLVAEPGKARREQNGKKEAGGADAPTAGERPDIAWRPLSRPPEDFPGFGAPVYAPADGTVVRVRHRLRDHRSRNSWPWVLGSVLENTLRELGGPTGMLGNHVTVDVGGAYVLLGHLQRGSVSVREGDRVTAGQQLARCGNSGACTEPQVRLQLMDRSRPLFAAGLPVEWAPGWNTATGTAGLPETWRPVVVRAGQRGPGTERPGEAAQP